MDLLETNVAYASVDSVVASVNRLIVNPLIILLFAIALAFFLWGMLKFFLNPDNEESRTEGKQHMVWGVIGMSVMMGVYAIVNIALRTFNIQGVDFQKGEVNLPNYNPQYPPIGQPRP